MNGYLTRLMRQSAVKISGSDAASRASPSPAASDAVAVPADFSEEETIREVPLSEVRLPALSARAGQSIVAAAPPPAEAPAEHESYAEAKPRPESSREVPPIQPPGRSAAGAIPFVSIGQPDPLSTPNERPSAKTVHPLGDESSTRVEASSSAAEAQEIVREVVAWVTDTPSPAAAAHVEPTKRAARTGAILERDPSRDSYRSHDQRARDASTSAVDSLSSDFPDRRLLPSAEAHLSATSASKMEPWSVQIDSIHLTIEEPAAKPVAAPVVPRVTPDAVSAPPGFTPSQLRRHYLRPF